MTDKLKKFFNEETKISLGLMIAIIGGIVWITRVAFVTESTASDVADLKKDRTQLSSDIAEMKADIRFIKLNMTFKKGD